MLAYFMPAERWFKRETFDPIGCQTANTNCALDVYRADINPGNNWKEPRQLGIQCRMTRWATLSGGQSYPGVLKHTMNSIRFWSMDPDDGSEFELGFTLRADGTLEKTSVGPRIWFLPNSGFENLNSEAPINPFIEPIVGNQIPNTPPHAWRTDRHLAHYYYFISTLPLGLNWRQPMFSLGNVTMTTYRQDGNYTPQFERVWTENEALAWEAQAQSFLVTDRPLLARRDGTLVQRLVRVEAPA